MLKQTIIPTCKKEIYERKSKIKREEENPENVGDPAETPVTPTEPQPTTPEVPDQAQPTGTDAPQQPTMPQQPTTSLPETPTQPQQPLSPSQPDASNFVYSSNEPYPEITNAYPSMYEVKLIKWQVSSKDSEFSAINTYLYQDFILQDEYPEIAEALRQIAIVEMTHFDLLSEAIVDFGGNPNLTDGRGNVWTGRNIVQLKNPREILLSNIRGEEKAIRNYQIAAAKTCNASLAALFERIILDEQDHIIIFNELLKTLN
ncbi:MAG: hypothetical protein MR024_00465 [Firmicutes bacterium]|nr:hypothetical protein [Bacillota bacterium]